MKGERIFWPVLCVSLAALFLAPTAWAVVGNVEVNVADDDGNAVPGATVSLIAPGQPPRTVVTDSSGNAVIEVDEGTYTMEVRDGNTKVTETIVVRPGQTTRLRVSLPPFSAAWTSPPPSMSSGPSFVYLYEDLDDMERTASMSVDTITATTTTGQTLTDREEVVGDAARLAEANATLDTPLEVKTAGAEFQYTFYGRYSSGNRKDAGVFTNAFGLPAFGRQQFAQDYGDSGPGGSGRVFASVSGLIGRADVDFQVVDLDSRNSETNSGDGLLWGLGGSVLIRLCDDCGLYTGAVYKFRKISDLDTTRSPAISGDAFVTSIDTATFDYDGNSIEGILGYTFNRASVFGGVRGAFRKVTFEGEVLIEFTQLPPGFVSANERLTFSEEFEENTVEGVAGIDVRVGHFIVGVEGNFGSGTKGAYFRAGYAF